MSIALKVEYEGENRRIRIQGSSYKEVRAAVEGIFGTAFGGSDFDLFYQDEEGDDVMVATDMEIADALSGKQQLKLKVKTNGKKVEVQENVDTTTEEEEEKEKEEEKEEAEESEEKVEMVPLSQVISEEITSNPFFIRMREDFGKFVEDVRGSMPTEFPENVRDDFTGVMDQIREPVQGFIKGLEEKKDEVMVPSYWKENPLVMRVNDSMQNCREGFEARSKRWAEAKTTLEEMGFEESAFVQRVLIIVHDGNLKLVLDDLLMRQQKQAQVQSTFQWLCVSLAQLFRDFGASVSRHSRAIATQVSEGIQNSASYVQEQVENSQMVEKLQGELGRNVECLQATLAQLNKAGEHVDKGFHNGLNQAVERSATIYQSAHRHGYTLSANTVGLLSHTVHGLNSLVLRMSELAQQSVHKDEDPLFTCDVCDLEVRKGPRFVCAECQSFSTCEACAASEKLPHDPEHVFLKISDARQRVNAQRYLTKECVDMLNKPQVRVLKEEVEEFELTELKEAVEEEKEEEQKKDDVEPSIQMDEIVDPRLQPSLETLREMGYCDDDKNEKLLLAHSFIIEEVLDALQ